MKLWKPTWILFLALALWGCQEEQDSGPDREFVLAGSCDTGCHQFNDFYLSLTDPSTWPEGYKSAREISYGESVRRGIDLDDDGNNDLQFITHAMVRSSYGPGYCSGGCSAEALNNEWKILAQGPAHPNYIQVLEKGDTVGPGEHWEAGSLCIAYHIYLSAPGEPPPDSTTNCNASGFMAVRQSLKTDFRYYWLSFETDTLGIRLLEYAHN